MLLKKVSVWVAGIMLILAVVGGSAAGGFFASYRDIGPFNNLAERIERKLRETAGEASELEGRVEVIETTNVRLRGTVYDIPRDEFSSGGALAPWGNDLLVMDRRGTIRRLIENEGIVSTGIRPPDNGHLAYEALAASPEYASYYHTPDRQRYNELLLIDTPFLHGLTISYSFFDPEAVCYSSRVAWLDVPRDASAATLEADPEDWEVIFETHPCLELNPSWTAFDGMMAGGRMAFEAPSTLYLGSGEYHLDGVHTYDVGIQSPDTDYGKVVAIDLVSRAARHHSIGHRNMQGVAIDKGGRLWTTEHMIRGGDELNLIREGENYGWPMETYGTLYSGLPFPNQGQEGRHGLHASPAYAWLPSAAVSGLAAIDGFHPAWDGDLLATSLSNVEYGQSLFRIRVEGEDVIFAERIKLRERLRYVTQWGPDKIAVLTDSRNVVIVFRAEKRDDVLGRSLARLEANLTPDLYARIARAARGCNECHSYERNSHGAAPSLAAVIDREIGGGLYGNYSDAMANVGGVWDREALVQFLVDPQSVVPGTSMPAQRLEPGPVVDGLVELLGIVGSETQDPDLRYD